VITRKVNTNLILAMTYLLQEMQELFCEDDIKRGQTIKEYRDHKLKLVKGLDYILNQAEKFHQLRLEKGGKSDGNSSVVSMAAQKRAS
jgi:hypothetical protein